MKITVRKVCTSPKLVYITLTIIVHVFVHNNASHSIVDTIDLEHTQVCTIALNKASALTPALPRYGCTEFARTNSSKIILSCYTEQLGTHAIV